MHTRALAAVGLALALAGCTIDTTPNLFVAGICGPPDDAVQCTAPAGSCSTYLNGNLLVFRQVTDATGTYVNFLTAVAEVGNQSPSNADDGVGRVNTRDAIITSASVSYTSPGLAISAVNPPDLYTPVRANATSTIFLPVMSSATLAEIGGQIPAATASVEVVAHLKLKGTYLDGSSFETGVFDIPVRVVNATFDATTPCADPLQVRFFCYYPGQGGREKCAVP